MTCGMTERRRRVEERRRALRERERERKNGLQKLHVAGRDFAIALIV